MRTWTRYRIALWLVAVAATASAAWSAGQGIGSELVLRLSSGDWVSAFSAESARVASVAGRRVRIWDLRTARLDRELRHTRGEVESLLLSPDGNLVASVQDGHRRGSRVALWDRRTGREVRTMTFPEYQGMEADLFAVFSSDGQRLATVGLHVNRKDAECSGVRIWDLRTGRCEQFIPTSTLVISLAFSPDGKRLAIGTDYSVELRVVGKTAPTKSWTIGEKGRSVSALAFSPDGELLASGSDDRTVRLWTVPDGRLKRSLEVPATDMTLAFSRDGRSLIAVEKPDFGMRGGGHVARRWDLATGKVQTLRVGGKSELYAATSDGTAVLGQSGNTIRRWWFPR